MEENTLLIYVVTVLLSVIACFAGWGFNMLMKKLDYMTRQLDAWAAKTIKIESRLENHILRERG